MPQLAQNPDLFLKVIFLVHFVFIALSSIGVWASSGYVFYNFVLILLLLWAIKERNNDEPMQLAIVVNSFSVVIDILVLVMSYPSYDYRAREKVSAAMAILHLIVRPLTTLCLVKILHIRGGLADGGLEDVFAGRRRGYDDIDQVYPSAAPHGEDVGEPA